MANNRTGRGVLILMCILATVVAGIYLGRRNPHPLDLEAQQKAGTSLSESADSAAMPRQGKSEKRRRSEPAKKRADTKRRALPENLPSPHDSPVSPITE